ncbi:hypothetical protein MO973_02505 [Paenibacillus sp. TRM 82003]|nr:hypothetical protein [Paenibacillus sp. TRM 82003]
MNLAHRGASHYAPENTLPSFYKGLEMGANGMETDLRYSKDGVAFLFHDIILDRTTDGSGYPNDYTWKELQQLDAGSWFSSLYEGERLIDLNTYLHTFGRRRIHFVFELKDPGMEKELLSRIREYGLEGNSTVTSFHFEYIETMRRLDSAIRIGQLLHQVDEDALQRLADVKAQQICPKSDFVTPEAVATAKLRGLEVRAWSVRTEELMMHCLASGVDGMTINFPDKLTAALQNKV